MTAEVQPGRPGATFGSPARPGAVWHDGEWYVNASALTASRRKLVLKDNEAFLVCDARGDLPAALPASELGYYYQSTRHLSAFEMLLGGEPPLVLHAGPSLDDERLEVHLTNAKAWDLGTRRLPSSTIYLFREIALVGDVVHQRITLRNYDVEPVDVPLVLRLGCDFADMFEVRGTPRKQRGRLLPPVVEDGALRLSYQGLDGRLRATRISCEPAAQEVDGLGLYFSFHMGPKADREVRLRIEALEETAERSPGVLVSVSRRARTPARQALGNVPSIRTSHAGLSGILERALQDLVTMLSVTPHGLYPYAGIPWYCAPFGRDGAWVGLQLLPWMPEVARGVLQLQAAHQALDFDDFTDREPGKIFHEMRAGEMANLREIPFVPYYGSADATPLFLVLLCEYVRTTGDRDLLARLWPHALRALEWIRVHGDLDGDGFVEYRARSPLGLRNQCWKDSFDSISHHDGALAEPPVAACDVQAYVYRALAGCMELAELQGERELATELLARARTLSERIQDAFWLEEEGIYALALDRDKRRCRVLTTNAGHLLWAGAVPPEPGHRTALRLTSPELSTGFGLRTLADSAARFNPLSYHNGSIWPHDNAIVAEGVRRYGHLSGAFEIFRGVVEALSSVPEGRVPELYCGFRRQPGEPMTPYPVACSPQAWSSGAMLAFVRMLLGLSVQAEERTVRLDNPVLPEWLDWIEVRNLPVGGGTMDFLTVRGRMSSSVDILAKPAGIQVLVMQ